MVEEDDYKLLKEVWKANGWSVGEATRRAIHALFAYDAHLKGRADNPKLKGDAREVLERVRRDVDPGLLAVPKPMRQVETDAGWAIGADDLTFFVEEDRLFARRDIGEQVEVYEVIDGRLALKFPVAPTAAAVALT
jgi:hypothetical protein